MTEEEAFKHTVANEIRRRSEEEDMDRRKASTDKISERRIERLLALADSQERLLAEAKTTIANQSAELARRNTINADRLADEIMARIERDRGYHGRAITRDMLIEAAVMLGCERRLDEPDGAILKSMGAR